MSKDKPTSDLVKAAQQLESDLAQLDELARTVRKIHLDSEKNLTRAGRELQQVLKFPEQIAASLLALGNAMQSLQQRQQGALQPLAEFAEQIQARSARLQQHMHAFAALGSLAGEITGVLQAEGEEAARIAQAQSKLEHLLDQAKQLFEAARKDDFPEVARDVDALRQRIVALRKRLVLPVHSKSNGV